MKKRTLIAILGIWVALIPSLGLPSSWKHWVIVVSGLAITFVALKRKYIVVEDTTNMEIPFEAQGSKNTTNVSDVSSTGTTKAVK